MILAVETVDILCPEANLRPPHKIQNISIQIGSIAREGAPWAGELKAGLKSEFDPVHRAAGPETQNRRYAASSHKSNSRVKV